MTSDRRRPGAALTNRDRLVAALFSAQLVGLLVFGLVLVHGTHFSSTDTTRTVYGAGAGPVAGGPTGSGASAGAAGSAGSAGTVVGGGTGAGPQAPARGDDAGTGTVAAGAPIKVGAVVSQTGAISFAASAQGTKAYIDMVNRNGGVNGHKIELDLRDDQLDATRGRAQAQQLLAEGVFCFMGWQAPQTEATIVPFLAQNKIPLIGNYGVGAEYHSAYSYPFESHHYGYEMGRFLALEPGVRKPGVIFIGNSSSAVNDAQKRAFTAGVASAGKSLASGDVHQVDVTQASYDDIVTSLRLDGVDGVATIVDQTAYNRLQQSFDRQGYHPVHVADPLFTDPTVTQSASTNGTLVASDVASTDLGGPDVQQYVAAVKAEFGGQAQVSYIGETGWLDAKVFVEAVRRMGPTITRTNLLSVMNALPTTVGGDITPQGLHFGAPVDHDANQCLALSKVVNGRLEAYKPFACDTKSFDG